MIVVVLQERLELRIRSVKHARLLGTLESYNYLEVLLSTFAGYYIDA